jgi:signal transduction histidine kinase
MSDPDLVAQLAQHKTLGAAPHNELEWLASHGYMRHLDPGELVRKGEPVESMWVFLTGHFTFYQDRGLGPRRIVEWRAGDVSGALPYSRVTTSPGQGVILEPSDIFMLDREHFPALIHECPVMTEILVHRMLDRTRTFTSSELQDKKMASLGRMSAGLAHELNNPASAVTRAAKLLPRALAELEHTSRNIGAAGLTAAQFEAIDQVRVKCATAPPSALTPIERADREESLIEWLEAHGADSAAASALVDTGATIDGLDTLAAAVHDRDLDAAVRWIASGCTIRTLSADIDRAASRMHTLVGAMKRQTFMDRAQVPESIDLSQGIHDSAALLLHKARKKSVGVAVSLESIPRVWAIGSDLNSVWTNLIDNAIDAAPESGHVEITARRELTFVVVRIIDNGHGIPDDIRDRVFDEFYTTKPVGQGTGLGLELARSLVRRNGGDIDFESRPGRTEFRVSLPIASEARPGQ